MKTLDRTPPLTCESSPHKRRKSGRAKPFKIERRWVPKLRDDSFISKIYMEYRDWHCAGSYETERGRDDALRAMRNKRQPRRIGEWEYR